MAFMYPEYSLRLRRDVVEWITAKGGKKFLRKLIYRLYSKHVARQLILSRRKEHKELFKRLKQGEA